ncbi:hypothetical protein Rhopal_001295-T1 [Rhodotorula paludigena]|uniref:Methionine aminopeptidase n=1 Tax=Rhodotorula paludigena TaxID=86838 RepID=A0AAV5GF12_9BASI|nr:hypothetical protein Rhopal_001295-T1 [Rhodotorula paludigena]
MSSSNGATNGTSAAAAPAEKGAAGATTPRMCANGCGKKAGTLECPKCKDLGRGPSFFCSQMCFASKYPLHVKKMHAPAPKEEYKYDFPEGTVDGFIEEKRHKGFVYTGKLRAVMPVEPVPKRTLPDHIQRPDYATEGELIASAQQRWSAVWGGRILGKAEEVGRTIAYGLRDLRNIANMDERQGRILNPEQIEAMRKVCRYGREVLDIAAAAIRPGITTLEIDAIVHEECIKRDSYPSPLGYHLFPRSVCTSINEVICHGIPDARPLEDGDIINLDVSLFHGGFHSDLNATYPVGSSVPQVNLDLIACARECLDEAIRMCKPGVPYQNLGGRIEEIAKARGFSTNKTYCGHGVNQLFHCRPNVPHYAGNRATGSMRPGQTFTIEPMICVGEQKETHWPDNWTAVTRDGKASAQFEETLLITETGVEVLTAAPGWVLPGKESEAAPGGSGDGTGAAKKKNKKKKKKTAGAAAGAATAEGEKGEGEQDAAEGDAEEA